MKTTLCNGRVPPAATADQARLTIEQLRHEATKIETQLEDLTRAVSFKTMREYDDWKARARGALRHVREEARAWEAWVEEREAVPPVVAPTIEEDYAKFWETP